MTRKLAFLTVFSVPALFLTTIICAEQAGMPEGALRQNAFEQGMAEAGWDIHKPANLAFYNVRQIIARNDILSLQNEIDKKITSEVHASRAVDSSA